ncbi:CYTH domain-containing protein [Clostridium sp. DSM 8431]|uniref:CYTH domain-containing protein n=1 Tax=Clostridium sp. DSM 8431 TaxID=1761781 RepID=UPI000B7D7149
MRSCFKAKVKSNSLEEDEDLKIKDELTIDLSKKEAEDILENKEIKKYIHLFEDKAEVLNEIADKLIVIGNLSTERTNYFINEEAMISLDKSRYLGKEDYEIELETENIEADRKFLNNLFCENNIEVFGENKSKLKRFIEVLMKNI